MGEDRDTPPPPAGEWRVVMDGCPDDGRGCFPDFDFIAGFVRCNTHGVAGGGSG